VLYDDVWTTIRLYSCRVSCRGRDGLYKGKPDSRGALTLQRAAYPAACGLPCSVRLTLQRAAYPAACGLPCSVRLTLQQSPVDLVYNRLPAWVLYSEEKYRVQLPDGLGWGGLYVLYTCPVARAPRLQGKPVEQARSEQEEGRGKKIKIKRK
jgi:hypothetical protein